MFTPPPPPTFCLYLLPPFKIPRNNPGKGCRSYRRGGGLQALAGGYVGPPGYSFSFKLLEVPLEPTLN